MLLQRGKKPHMYNDHDSPPCPWQICCCSGPILEHSLRSLLNTALQQPLIIYHSWHIRYALFPIPNLGVRESNFQTMKMLWVSQLRLISGCSKGQRCLQFYSRKTCLVAFPTMGQLDFWGGQSRATGSSYQKLHSCQGFLWRVGIWANSVILSKTWGSDVIPLY